MLYLYDVAIKDHLKSVYPNVYLAERTQLFKRIREGSTNPTGNITLPVVGVWRIENSLDSDLANFAEFNRGMTTDIQVTDGVKALRGINIPLTYQLDILGGSFKDCDDLLCDTIMYLKTQPMVTFNRGGLDFAFGVELMDLSISTDFGSFSESGTIYSQSLTVIVKEARILFFTDKKKWDTILADISYATPAPVNSESVVFKEEQATIPKDDSIVPTWVDI